MLWIAISIEIFFFFFFFRFSTASRKGIEEGGGRLRKVLQFVSRSEIFDIIQVLTGNRIRILCAAILFKFFSLEILRVTSFHLK